MTEVANQLQNDLISTPQYKELEKAFSDLKEDKAAYQLFKNFQQSQNSLQQKQAQGSRPTDQEIKSFQSMAQEMRNQKSITTLMTKERQVSDILDGLNKIITKPLLDLYQN